MNLYKNTMAQLQSSTTALRDLAADTASEVAEVRRSPDLTPEAKQQHVRKILDESRVEFERLLAQGREAEADVDRSIAAALTDRAGDTPDQLLREQRNARGWARAQRLLDGGMAAREAVELLASHGDIDALNAFDEELPSFVYASHPRRDQRTAAATAIESTRRLLDEARLPLAPADTRDALDARLASDDLKVAFKVATETAVKAVSTGAGIAPIDRIRQGYATETAAA